MAKNTLPPGQDVRVAVLELQHGEWIIDPETGEWAEIKQIQKHQFRCSMGRHKAPTCLVSLRRIGQRELAPELLVTMRMAEVSNG